MSPSPSIKGSAFAYIAENARDRTEAEGEAERL